ncbi:Probable potassium transport system protein kup [Galdieria sulphuraria]|nr:Probable potassium transport system protein kup [Galdieria sulphuraria]
MEDGVYHRRISLFEGVPISRPGSSKKDDEDTSQVPVEIQTVSEALTSSTTRIQYRKSLLGERDKTKQVATVRRISLAGADAAEFGGASNSVSFEDPLFREDKLGALVLLRRTVQIIGLCYGDLGTSPLYTVASLVDYQVAPSSFEIYAAASMIFWLLVLVPSVKYAVLVTMADHNGEGGAFAMIGLLRHKRIPRKWLFVATIIASIGAGALLADGIITPAITVVSAIQGIQVGAPSLSTSGVIGITIAILFLIFASQWFGSSKIGIVYGPVLSIFFIVQAIAGIYNITKHPAIFKALNPYYALKGIGIMWNDGKIGYLRIADALLSVTGSEAMYADMGHFGRTPLRIGWFFVVFPSVWMSYFGQLALVASNPQIAVQATDKLYFFQVSNSLLWPLIVITTLASIIASQAIISGSFSILSQAVGLNIFPRLHFKRTDFRIYGQVFMPSINVIMGILTIVITAGFQTSSALTSAYGVAVSTSFITTSMLFVIIISVAWKVQPYIWIWYPIVFGLVDLLLWSSALTKVPSGGYIPIAISIVTISLILIYRWGAKKEEENYKKNSLRWSEYKAIIESPQAPVLLDRTFVFLTSMQYGIPFTYSQFVKQIGAIPRLSLFVTVRYVSVPFVDSNHMYYIFKYTDQLYRIIVNVGYAQSIDNLVTFIESSGLSFLDDTSSTKKLAFVKGKTELLSKKEHWFTYRFFLSVFGIMKMWSARIDTYLGIPFDSLEISTSMLV